MTSTLRGVSDWEFEQYVQAEVDGIATPDAARGARGRPGRLARRPREPPARDRGAPRARPHHSGRGTRAGRRRPRVGGRPHRGRLGPAQQPTSSAQRRDAQSPSTRRAPGVAPRRARVARRPRRTPCSSRCRGSPDASSAWAAGGGEQVAGDELERAARGGRRAERGLDPSRPVPLPDGRVPTRFRSRSATCWAGSSPRAPVRSATTIGPSVRWLGRVAVWAVELTARGAMVPHAAPAHAVERERDASRTVRTRCAGRPRSSTRRASTRMAETMPRRRVRVRPQGRRARARPARRSPAWSTRSAATARAGSKCRRRRRACAPRTTSPRRSSPASTAARSTRR